MSLAAPANSLATRAFRSSLAAEGEPLITLLLDIGDEAGFRLVLSALERLEPAGLRPRLLVIGDSSSILGDPESESSIRSRISFVESWAASLLGQFLSVSDILLPLGLRSSWPGLDLGAHRNLGVIVPEEALGDFPGGGETRSTWKRRDPEELALLLRDHITKTSRPGNSETPVKMRPKRLASSSGYLIKNDWGIGDELLLSAVAREIVRTYPSLSVWIRSRHGFKFPGFVRRDPVPSGVPVIETIYQNPTLYSPVHYSPFPGHLVQQMLDKFALDTGLPVRAVDVRPELDLGPLKGRSARSRSVIVHSRPNPRLPSKDWGLERWRELARILSSMGISVRQVGGKEEPLLEGAEDLRGTPAGELPRIFLESGAVISVVGLLMHLAEATRTPAVVIYGGREHPAIDGYPDQVHLSSHVLPCRGRWGCHLAPDLDCPHGMKCMDQIHPMLVARQVLSLLGAGPEGARRTA